MATVGTHNRAHINTAYFCYSDLDNLEIYFLSDPKSTHAMNLSKNPSIAMAVFRTSQDWGGSDRGMQLFGTCAETQDRLAVKAERLYRNRFTLYARWMVSNRKNEKRLARQLRSYRFYRFLPNKVKVLDAKEFGANFITANVLRHGQMTSLPTASPR